MLLTCGVSNTLSVLLIFETLKKITAYGEKLTHVTHFQPLFDFK